MMAMVASKISLSLCSVLIRRFFDSYTGRPLPITYGLVPNPSTVALVSGALICLYHQLRKGTLVKIGIGRKISSVIQNSRHTIQRRVKNNSWFLRNVEACRRKCTEAMSRIAQQPNDSLENVQAETGTLLLNDKGPPVEKIYGNKSFGSNEYSTQDVREQFTSRCPHHPSRPITRNYVKCLFEDASCGDCKSRFLPRKRKKSIQRPKADDDHHHPGPVASSPPVRNQSFGENVSKRVVRRPSMDERLKKAPKIQKITRKTRSGRVYAYRL